MTKSFDPLDMNNYRIEQLSIRPKSGFERWIVHSGFPLAIIERRIVKVRQDEYRQI
ncbi:MAG: hypothetical protein LBH91_06520 [Prevotellaceae bacterium]|nr:hypothetical protein [Prevotellaceae bacterium]